MKNFFNSRVSVAILAAFFFAGCAGISDANLSDIDGSVQDEGIISEADFTQNKANWGSSDEEGEVIFGDGDQEDIIIVTPRERDNRNR